MAAGVVTTTTAAGFIPEEWSLDFIEAYTTTGVLKNIVDTSFQELSKAGYGDTINVPNVEAAAVYDISQGSAVTQLLQASGAGSTAATTQIIVSTWKGVDIAYPDIVSIQAMPTLRKGHALEAGAALSKAIDTSIATLVASVSQNVGTLAVALTDPNFRESRRLLDVANVPMEDRYLVVSPDELMEMYDVEKYANSLYKGSTGNLDGSKGNGYVGPIYCYDVYESNNMVADTGGHDNLVFQKKWCALVVQKGPSTEYWREGTKLLDHVIFSALWGVKEMRATSAVWMKGK